MKVILHGPIVKRYRSTYHDHDRDQDRSEGFGLLPHGFVLRERGLKRIVTVFARALSSEVVVESPFVYR